MNIGRKTIRGPIGAALACLLAFLAGCHSSSETSYKPANEDLLCEVWTMYSGYVEARKYAPTRLSDLDPYEPGSMYGYAAVRDGEVVVLWGGTGARVLAYEKQVPEQGGAVLYRDGTIGHMSAAEFNAIVRVR